MKHRKPSITLALGALIISGLFVFTAVGASAATTFFQGFETGISDWTPLGDDSIARVPSGDASTYATGIPAATGGYFARVGVDPTPGSCVNGGGTQNRARGPYTEFGGEETTFPTGGYSTGLDVYLDVSYATAHPDTRFDWTSAINQPDGTFRRDFVFNATTDATGFVFDGSNNGDRCSTDPAGSATAVHVTTSGWYTMKHTFTGVSGGQLSVQMDLIRQSDNAVVGSWTRSDPSDIIGTTVGGHAYGWFVQNEFDGLAIDNTRLALLTPPPPSADLSVTKTDSPDPAHIGQKLTYTMPVVNSGPDAATGVVLTDTLPKTAGFYSVSATQGTCTRTKTTVTCNLGSLASGATDTVTLVVKPTVKGTITNTVTVAAASPTDPNTTNNTATQNTLVKP